MPVRVLILAFLLLPAASSGFLQWAGDAERTGTAGTGPDALDVALDMQLDGLRPGGAPPLILDGAVYVLTTHPRETETSPAGEPGLWRIDLATAQVSRLVSVTADDFAEGLASDGERLFVLLGTRLLAVDLQGRELWESRLAVGASDPDLAASCAPLAVRGGEVVAACTVFGDVATAPAWGARDGQVHGVWGFRTDTGESTRRWLRSDAGRYDLGSADAAVATGSFVTALAVGPDHAYVATLELAQPLQVNSCTGAVDDPDNEGITIHVWAISVDGLLDWTWATPLEADEPGGHTSPPPATVMDQFLGTPALLVDGNHLYVQADRTFDLNSASGCIADDWLYGEDSADPTSQNVLAAVGGDLVLSARGALVRVDPSSHAVRWQQPAPDGFDATAGMVTDGRLAATFQRPGILTLYDVETGDVILGRSMHGGFQRSGAVAMADGIAVFVDGHARVVVFGSVPAGITAQALVSDLFPPLGEPFELDLSMSLPGALAGDLEFRVVWGDGATEPWTSEQVLVHAYEAEGPWYGIVEARNSAGQEATAPFVVNAGLPPPVEPERNALSRLFAPENQEGTFFALGLGITAVGAIIGGLRLSSRRRRLRALVRRVDDAARLGQRDSLAASGQLVQLEHSARNLLEAGRIDEAQFTVVTDRIAAARRGIRMQVVEEGLGFLPFTVARRLQAMLADGIIDRWEHEHVRQAVKDTEGLSAAQRKAALAQVADWFKQDR